MSEPVDGLQFQRAEPANAGSRSCAACKRPIAGEYYQAAGHAVCADCAQGIHASQAGLRNEPLAKAVVYGVGAAIAGCAIYAAVSILFNLEIGLISILVGIMVGKAIRFACQGRGGRPQQILAVLLTYFAITSSYVVVAISHAMQKNPGVSVGISLPDFLLLAVAGPFLSLRDVSGFLSLLILFFGLRQAWTLTGRRDLVLAGPYRDDLLL